MVIGKHPINVYIPIFFFFFNTVPYPCLSCTKHVKAPFEYYIMKYGTVIEEYKKLFIDCSSSYQNASLQNMRRRKHEKKFFHGDSNPPEHEKIP